MVGTTLTPEHLREEARRIRRDAEHFVYEDIRRQLLDIADRYEGLARVVEELGSR